MQKDRNDNEFIVCHNCKHYVWTGNRMENLS